MPLSIKSVACASAVLVAMCAPTYPQTGPTGTWRVESTPPWEVVLRTDGSRLTGKVSQCTSQVSAEIIEGRIDGNTLTFKCKSPDEDRSVTLTGVLKGEEIAFTWSMQVRPGGAVADPNARGRQGILGPSSPQQFVAKRVADGRLAQEVDMVRGLELAGSVNIAAEDTKGEAVLFLPQGTKQVRGVIVVIAWGLGFGIYDNLEFHKLAQTLDFGLVKARIRYISEPNAEIIGPGRIPAAGSTHVLLRLLQGFADESGHKEIASAPIVLWGHSAAGGQISRLAASLPERTIAFVRYHSGAGMADTQILSKIPALILDAGKDPSGNQSDIEAMWRKGRSLSAPWTFALEPEAEHGDSDDLPKSNRVMIPWITAVVRQRLPANGKSLRTVTDGSAWMGNNQTGEVAPYGTFPGSKVEASWLPDEASARGWQTVLHGAK